MFSAAAPPDAVEEFRRIMLDIHPVGFQTMARALAEAEIRDVPPAIAVPSLLLYGDRDVRAPLAVARDLHATIPGSRLVAMPGVGHMSSLEAPERFATEVRFFLRSLSIEGT